MTSQRAAHEGDRQDYCVENLRQILGFYHLRFCKTLLTIGALIFINSDSGYKYLI